MLTTVWLVITLITLDMLIIHMGMLAVTLLSI
jgi:hypothetical protein